MDDAQAPLCQQQAAEKEGPDRALAMASVQGYGLKSEAHRDAGWVYPGSGGTHDSRQASLAPGISLLSNDAPDAGKSTLLSSSA